MSSPHADFDLQCPLYASTHPPVLLGTLGAYTHLRCRDCNWAWHESAEDFADLEEDETDD